MGMRAHAIEGRTKAKISLRSFAFPPRLGPSRREHVVPPRLMVRCVFRTTGVFFKDHSIGGLNVGHGWRPRLRGKEYFESTAGLLAQHRACRRRRVYISINGVEPRKKGRMSDMDEIILQTQILEQMEKLGRRAYRGPIVLDISVDTTVKNPPQAHSIAKNLLDLLSRPRPELGVGRNLLYQDDVQIHGLSFWCRHGQNEPRIHISATPLSCFRTDLAIALEANRKLRREDGYDPYALDDALASLKDLLRDEQRYRRIVSERTYASMLDHARFRAQEELLGETETTLLDLAAMYQVVPRNSYMAPAWEQMNKQLVDFFRRHRLRIHLDELPWRPGTSDQYVADVEAQIANFVRAYKWVLQPLRIPLALQVITRPSPPTGKDPPKNDLDNVVRNYVVPRVVAALAPPSDIAWTVDLTRLSDVEAAWWKEQRQGVPKEPQIKRYEAWRLPIDGTRGFVSVSLVPDIGNLLGPLIRIDQVIEDWLESRERDEEWW